MDFINIRMDDFLKASIPNRFQDVTPFDFEDFIAFMFSAAGYEVTQTDYTGDFGADLIIQTQGETTAVQVKRYQASSAVGAQDLNQIIGARTYYKTDHALILTTSKYTSAAIKLAESADVELWDWDMLNTEMSKIWMNGEDYFTYFSEGIKEVSSHKASLKIDPQDFDVFENEKYHFLHFEIENDGTENLKCQLELPLILTKNKKQIQASQWVDDYFSEGLLYAGARISVRCLFLTDQLSSLERGDRLIQKVFLADKNAFITIDQQLVDRPGSCFVTTYCFGKYSLEYLQMIYIRDNLLQNYFLGRMFIHTYYSISPVWKIGVEKYPGTISFIRPALKWLIKAFLRLQT